MVVSHRWRVNTSSVYFIIRMTRDTGHAYRRRSRSAIIPLRESLRVVTLHVHTHIVTRVHACVRARAVSAL